MSYRHRRRGDVTASDRTEFVARRRDNGAKFGCVDPDRIEDDVGSSEDLELRVLCKFGRIGTDILALKHESRILGHSSNHVYVVSP